MLEKIFKENVNNQIGAADETDILKTRLQLVIKMHLIIFGVLFAVHLSLSGFLIAGFFDFKLLKYTGLYLAAKALKPFLPYFKLYGGYTTTHLFYYLQEPISKVLWKIVAVFVSTSFVYLAYIPILQYLKNRAGNRIKNRHLRGRQIVEPTEVLDQIKKDNQGGDMPVGVAVETEPEPITYEQYLRRYKNSIVPILKSLENKGVLFCGQPGSGKGLFMTPIIKRCYEKQSKGIIYDAKGDEYFCRFFDPQRDILLNFLDVRGEEYLWNFFDEIEVITEVNEIAESLVPPMERVDPFWYNAPRDILAGLILWCVKYNKKTYADLWQAITAPAEQIQEMLNNTQGAEKGRRYLEDPTSKMCQSVLSVLVQQTTCFSLMSRNPSKVFRIDDWIDSGEGFIYLTNPKSLRATLRGFYTLFIDTLARKCLSKQSDLSRRVFFFLDEFATLNKCMSVLEILNQGRSKGMATFIGIQDLAQLDQIWGDKERRAILTGCGTKLIFGVGDSDTAEYFAKLFGKKEETNSEKNYTVKANDSGSGDGIGIMNREKEKDLVLASQITGLPERKAFLMMRGFPLTVVEFPIVVIPNKPEVPMLMLRKDLYLSEMFKPQDTESGNELEKDMGLLKEEEKPKEIKEKQQAENSVDDYFNNEFM